MKPLAIHPEAEAELQVAAQFYEGQVVGLGLQFLEEVRECFRKIQTAPESWPVAFRRYRRVMPHRFPYTVFYEELPDRIWVVSVAHQKRRPGY
ncbi:MAG: type II toxin-antitoxin system RelE/ParE family toxin [Burkholderiales bacterium]